MTRGYNTQFASPKSVPGLHIYGASARLIRAGGVATLAAMGDAADARRILREDDAEPGSPDRQ
jgi:hypothetical protein